jgi:hypothetical protein
VVTTSRFRFEAKKYKWDERPFLAARPAKERLASLLGLQEALRTCAREAAEQRFLDRHAPE